MGAAKPADFRQVVGDRLPTDAAVRGGHIDDDPWGHRPDSHAVNPTGIPRGTLPSLCSSWSFGENMNGLRPSGRGLWQVRFRGVRENLSRAAKIEGSHA